LKYLKKILYGGLGLELSDYIDQMYDTDFYEIKIKITVSTIYEGVGVSPLQTI
jgi:hypothetical protein